MVCIWQFFIAGSRCSVQISAVKKGIKIISGFKDEFECDSNENDQRIANCAELNMPVVNNADLSQEKKGVG